MKIKMHYAVGKSAKPACGKPGNVWMTMNYKEITSGLCLRTRKRPNATPIKV